MTYLKDGRGDLSPTPIFHPLDPADGLNPHLKQSEGPFPISTQAAFEEFVKNHSELLRRLAL